ncbi:MAG: O-antigen ligase family protein [Proteobacteria bacterium]|nr:O-antigen ligase family protein [Pseudomonadota bacterium]
MLRSSIGVAGWAQPALRPIPSGLMYPRHPGEPLLLVMLGLMVFTGAFVVYDIAYNAASLATIGLFALLGLRIDRANMPLVFFLVLFNLAGLIALQPHLDFDDSREFVIGTCFVAVTAIFFCTALNQNALPRLSAMKWGLIAGALAASLAGIAGVLDIAGLSARFTMHEGRLSGTFRDPNVIGSFLILPALYLAQDFLAQPRRRLLTAVLLAPILLAWFLTYSRGSWIAMIVGLALLAALNFITARDEKTRLRLLLLVVLGLAGMAVAFIVLISNENIAAVFADRFTLQKDYDSGPSGRFGNQLRAIPELLTLPFGHGPNRHWLYYPENPHNTYMMAFTSYGWLGGILFFAFIGTTLVIACRTVLLRTPFQSHAIVVFSALIPHLIQNFQIDTDRWRHLFMIYGLTWGLAAISLRWLREYRFYAHAAYRAARERPREAPTAVEASA